MIPNWNHVIMLQSFIVFQASSSDSFSMWTPRVFVCRVLFIAFVQVVPNVLLACQHLKLKCINQNQSQSNPFFANQETSCVVLSHHINICQFLICNLNITSLVVINIGISTLNVILELDFI